MPKLREDGPALLEARYIDIKLDGISVDEQARNIFNVEKAHEILDGRLLNPQCHPIKKLDWALAAYVEENNAERAAFQGSNNEGTTVDVTADPHTGNTIVRFILPADRQGNKVNWNIKPGLEITLSDDECFNPDEVLKLTGDKRYTCWVA